MIRKIIIYFLVFIPLLFLTCIPPPFDEGLSLAYLTTGKLDHVAHYGPVYSSDTTSLSHWNFGSDYLAQAYYIPHKSATAQDFSYGFIVILDKSNYLSLKYVKHMMVPDGSLKMVEDWSTNSDYLGPLTDTKDAFHFIKVDVDSAITPCIGAVLNNNWLDYKIYSSSTSNNDIEPSPIPLGSLPAPSPTFALPPGNRIIAASLQDRTKDTATDRLTVLTWDENYKFCESFAEISNTSGTLSYYNLNSQYAYSLNLPVPQDISQAFYYHSFRAGAECSYLSYYHDGLFQTLKWSYTTTGISEPVVLPGVMYKPKTVLSTGEIFSVINKTAYVYDAEGKKKYDFPMGDLHFAFELTSGTESRMVFTLLTYVHGEYDGYWGNAIYLDIYTKPTKYLGELE